MNALQQQLLAGGRRVPWLKLCRWLGVARSTLYYQPHPRQCDDAIDEPLAAQIKKSSKSVLPTGCVASTSSLPKPAACV